MTNRLAAALAYRTDSRWCALCKEHHYLSEFYRYDNICAKRRRMYNAQARRRLPKTKERT